MHDIRGRLARGALWIGLTRALASLIGFASTLLLARLLTPEDFGLVAVAGTVGAIVASLTELSLVSALVQHRAPQEEHFHTVFTLNGARSILLTAGMCLAAWPIARFYGDPRLGPVIVAMALSGAVSGFHNPKLAVLTRELLFWQDFTLVLSQRLAGFVVAVAVALAFQSYWALVVGSAAAQVVNVALSYAIKPYRPRFGLARVRELFSFSVWLSLGQAVNTLTLNFDKLVLGRVYGPAVLGLYTVGDNLASLATREATQPIAQTLFPGFSRMVDEPERLRHAYLRAQSLLCAIAFPAGFGFAALAHLLVPMLLGEQWTGAVPVVQAIAAVVALQTLGTTLQPLAMAMGETRLLFGRDLLHLLVRVPAMVVGMVLAGFPGVLWGRAASGAVGLLIDTHLVRRLTGLPMREQAGANARALASSLVMVAAMLAAEARLAPSLGPAALVAAVFGVGVASFFAATAALWLAARRPDGPERELMGALAWLAKRAAPLLAEGRVGR